MTSGDDLLAIADANDVFIDKHSEGASIFVGELMSELRTATDAARRVDRAVADGDALGSFVFLRVVLESTIRLRWVAGDGDEPQAAILRDRIERLRGRDLARIRTALGTLIDSPGRREAIAMVSLEQASIRATKAPAAIEQLAVTVEGKQLYDLHRLCSSLIHPGVGIRRIELFDPAGARDFAAVALELASAIAFIAAGLLDRSAPD